MSASNKSRRSTDVLKNLPQNPEAEKSFLGSVILDNSVLDRDDLTPDDFHHQFHRQVYETMLGMWEDRIGIDPVTLADRMEKEEIDLGGGRREFLSDLEFIVPTAANSRTYAEILKEKSESRRAIYIADKLIRAATSGVPEDIARVYRELAKREDPDESEFPVIRPSIVFSKILPPPVYVLPSLRPRTVGLIVAQEGAGKSFLALEIGLAKATGYDMTGIGITGPGNGVVYFSKEDPPEIIEERLQAIEPFIDEEVRGKADGLEIVSLYGRPATIAAEKSVVNEKLVHQIIKKGSGKDLLIFDTLRKLHDLEENSSGEMNILLGIFDRIGLETGAAVLLIHHTNKSANLNGQQGDQSSARGSNVLVGNTRWSLHLEKIIEDSGEKKIKVTIPRANYGPEGGEWWLNRKAGGVLVAGPPPLGKEGGEKPKRSSSGRTGRTIALVTTAEGGSHYEQD
ncbi:MAG: replication protein A [Leptospirillum sp. Group II 'C75']|jgi:hypothetical protein|uniref:AAA family ATPase n=1 Tax=Leptospirillum sp. Group II 'CF-1' TaxID=1660083 RepID=UPI00029CD142|nr:AAA family ATPase [Leptospirillum sp. Group II 'CF-1']AKS23669.1 hypothetical protein ABH19_07820 [Leptospirillum sp. Group II 'CF-1']EIJ75764.1 MAG: replication protein A [Leptospirillum sp. Group II 'C75']